MIKINCAALPSGLVESELFGHEKGAFTGAIAKRIGRFELADGGTLFLDEVGEIPLEIQVKLLRVLQEREFDRIGGKAPIKVDVRIIAATNRNLLQAVAEKTFRDDLYYRLNVFPVMTPPLRERYEDIPLLVSYIINKFSRKLDKKVEGVHRDTLRLLQSYHWPGNIRELENVIERALILSDDRILRIDPSLLPGVRVAAESLYVQSMRDESRHDRGVSLEAVEREHILSVLVKTGWIIEGEKGAAQLLGMNPSTLRYRIKKLGIVKPARNY